LEFAIEGEKEIVMALGKSIKLSLPRQYISDLMHFAKKIPTIPVQRSMRISQTMIARARLASPPSWVVIFAKAYGVICNEYPELRRAYLAYPWARLFEYNSPIASIAIERNYQGSPAVVFLRMGELHCNRLVDLDKVLRDARQVPIERFRSFKNAKLLYFFPTFVRRLIWSIALNASPRLRAQQFGTFGLSVYAGLGADSLHPISPLTTTLNYGPISLDGYVNVRIIYDHRVLDGATVARALARLETVLTTDIVQELNQMELRSERQSA
jgi:hypothetical protein